VQTAANGGSPPLVSIDMNGPKLPSDNRQKCCACSPLS
jgi:hypothetical protein